MTFRDDLLGVDRHTVFIGDPLAAAGTDEEVPAFVAPYDCEVYAATLYPETAITGHATNFTTLELVNKGNADAIVASKAYDTPTDDDVAAFGAGALDLSGTPANLDLDAGDVVSVKKTDSGTGMALDGIIVIEFGPRR